MAERCRVPLEKLRKSYESMQAKEWQKEKASASHKRLNSQGIIGQDRAVESLQFGLDMNVPGYNMVVVGPPGTGKSTYVESIIKQLAKEKETPPDWCYVFNFNEEDKPIAVSLKAGEGKKLRHDMEKIVEEFEQSIPKAFDASENEQDKNEIIKRVQDQVDHWMRDLKEEAKESGFVLQQTPQQLFFVPLHEGKQMPEDQYEQLPLDTRKELEQKLTHLERKLEKFLLKMQHSEKGASEEISQLNEKVARSVTDSPMKQLKEKYRAYPKVQSYLTDVQEDMIVHHRNFHGGNILQDPIQKTSNENEQDPFLKYKVNLFVNNEHTKGAPAIIESFTNYYNVFGKIEYKSQFTNTTTDFTMIKPGAIHQANGGYLVLQAKDLLFDPFSWETLKKWLKLQEAIIENMGEQHRYVPTVTLRPEPIPLNVKVILIGSPVYYHTLRQDEEFQKLFKVKVDFDLEMKRNEKNIHQYITFIESIRHSASLLPFAQSAYGKIVEYGSKLAGTQNKLSTQFNDITEVVYESNRTATKAQAKEVTQQHVIGALKARDYRSGLIQEKLHDLIEQNKIMIQTEERAIGQVNGLGVMQLDRFAFGIPARITARTFAGTAGITNIERETDRSGSTHSKGVLTLAGYLGGKFAQKQPLGLSAQITFEQNYGGVDGDSASSAELYALLSSLADVPIKQGIAVTGSINQHGEIQPIGGATEKIEGFFDICRIRGLTGTQGVMIPYQNMDDLMLKEEVIKAIHDELFHVYCVKKVEEGIELLTDMPAGEEQTDGSYPEDSLFSLVQNKIEQYTTRLSFMPLYKEEGKK